MPDILKDIGDVAAAPINAAGGIIHGIGNTLGDVPVIGGALKYGNIGVSDIAHSVADVSNANFSKAGNDGLSAVSNAIHGVNTVPVVGKYILPAVAGFFGGPLGYGAATGIQNGFEASRKGASFGDAANYGLKSGALSGAGAYAGGQLLGPELNGIGSGVSPASGGATTGVLGTPISQSLSDTALSGVGNALGSTTPGDLIGSAVGSTVGESMAGPSPTAPIPPTPPWAPSRMDQSSLPASLSSFSSLDPTQQASNIATKGVYGGGQGPEENQYFLNLINRQLVDQQGKVGDMNSLPQIDNSYLAQLGLGGYSNTNDLLKGISQYQG